MKENYDLNYLEGLYWCCQGDVKCWPWVYDKTKYFFENALRKKELILDYDDMSTLRVLVENKFYLEILLNLNTFFQEKYNLW